MPPYEVWTNRNTQNHTRTHNNRTWIVAFYRLPCLFCWVLLLVESVDVLKVLSLLVELVNYSNVNCGTFCLWSDNSGDELAVCLTIERYYYCEVKFWLQKQWWGNLITWLNSFIVDGIDRTLEKTGTHNQHLHTLSVYGEGESVKFTTILYWISNQTRLPAEFKHIIKRRKRN